MDRAAYVVGQPRLVAAFAAAGVAVLAAVTAVGFSGAFYTTSSTSPDNVFSTSEVDLALAETGALFDAAALAPGDRLAAQQTVTNRGHSAHASLAVAVTVDGPLLDVLWLEVREDAPSSRVVYSGPLRGVDADLGVFGSAEQRRYHLELWWPPDAGGSLGGTSVAFDLTWHATSQV